MNRTRCPDARIWSILGVFTRSFPARGDWFLTPLVAGALAVASCNTTNNTSPPTACSLNSDCSAGLVCAFSRCRPRCVTSADCTDGLCVNDGRNAACQSAIVACDLPGDCPIPLACASDYRCRNLCTSDGDCNVLGISGRLCAADKNGVHYCADPPEVKNGQIVAPPPRGAPDASVIEPIVTMPVATSGDAAPADATMTAADATTSSEGSAVEPGADAVADSAGEAGFPPTGCTPACGQGTVCVTIASGSTCMPCGTTAGDPCCDAKSCGANLTCNAAGQCDCGGANQACCGGSTCRSGLACDTNDGGTAVCACGEPGTRCCPGADGGVATCGVGLACNGSKCSCVAAFATVAASGSAPGVALRVDGTVWASNSTETNHTFTEMVDLSGAPLRATAIAASGAATATPIGCAITVSGGVWCFPTGGTLTDSTFLGAGLGPTDSTSSPVQVIAASGAPLANIKRIAGGTSDKGANFCAVSASGSAWCWGYGQDGQLGNGGTSNSSYASIVMQNASTPFTGVVDVAIAYESTCAVRTEGTVWCWGNDYLNALGNGNGTNQVYPGQVQLPVVDGGAGASDAGVPGAARLAPGTLYTHCALMRDTTVICWGYTTGDRTPGNPAVVPTPSGDPFSGVLDLAGNTYRGPNGDVCAKNSSLQVFCWGGQVWPYPVAFQDGAGATAVGVIGPLSGSYYGLGYLLPSGQPVTAGVAGGPSVPCTGLLP